MFTEFRYNFSNNIAENHAQLPWSLLSSGMWRRRVCQILQKFWRYVFTPSSEYSSFLNLQIVFSSETSVNMYQTRKRLFPQDCRAS
jgi:hypothetical protein